VKDLIISYNQINKANIINLKLEQTLSTLKDAEIAQRGFLLTNDSVFLQPYNGAYEKSKKLLTDLKALTIKNADQQKNLNAITTFIEVRFKTFNTVIDQYNDPGINQETKKSHLLKGKTSMDSIRSHIAAIAKIESGLIASNEKARRKHSFMAPLFAFLLMVTAIGVLLFFYDKTMKQLTRSKKLLSKLRKINVRFRQKNYELELFNKELDSFTYIASHDLKEPLRKISVFSNLLEESEYKNFSEQNKNYFQRLKYSVERMQNLLDDLLLYSHVTKTSFGFEDVDLNEIIKDVQKNLSEEIEASGAKITTSTLPVIKGFSFQLRQLFENLVANSIKYRQPGKGICIKIESAVVHKDQIPFGKFKKSNEYYRITLKDNGLGFNQAYAEKVFEIFKQVHDNPELGGTGTGLSICKKIVQNHNGLITVVSKMNLGTKFKIYFPKIDQITEKIDL
jgi:signal transduction histidine kinase